MIVLTSSKAPIDDCFRRPINSFYSALLLYFSESRTKRRNSATVPIFRNFLLFMSVFYYVSWKYFEYCGNDSRDKTR